MNDETLTDAARFRIREFVAAEVVELIRLMALARGMTAQPSIPGVDAAAALQAVAATLEVGSRELMALAALAVPGWEVGVTEAELARAMAVRQHAAGNAILRAALSRGDGSATAG